MPLLLCPTPALSHPLQTGRKSRQRQQSPQHMQRDAGQGRLAGTPAALGTTFLAADATVDAAQKAQQQAGCPQILPRG